MSFESITDSETWKVLASIITGGAFVGWYREHRKGRKDKNDFAMEFIREQSLRIDKLVMQVAQLEADGKVATAALELAREQVHEAKNELFKANGLNIEKDAEILRLKTELARHAPRDVSVTEGGVTTTTTTHTSEGYGNGTAHQRS